MYEKLTALEIERILCEYEDLAISGKWNMTPEHAREMGMKTLLPGQRQNNLKSEIIEGNAPTPGGPKTSPER